MQTALPFEYRVLEKGNEVEGHKVLRCNRLTERVVGDCYASWIALVETTNANDYHKYATMVIVARPDGWLAESGRYFVGGDYEKAYGDYERRGGW